MIVSHEHQLIFLKPRKVAGTSFELALSKYLSGEDIITPNTFQDDALGRRLGFQPPCNFNFPILEMFPVNHRGIPRLLGYELPTKYYDHMPASLAKSRLPDRVWRNYRKISLIRNPWDRAVSLFFWKNNRPWAGKKADLTYFSDYFKGEYNADAKLSSRLDANHRIYMIDGKDVIDTYVRYEHFEQDIHALEADIPTLTGLWETFKKITAKVGTRGGSMTTAEIFADHPEADSLVREACAWEIEKFSYHLT